MSINPIAAFPTLTEVQPVHTPTTPRVSVVTPDPASTTLSPTEAQTSSALVDAIDQTLAEFGLNPEGALATNDPTANALAAQNANQTNQAFIGALYQAATEAQTALPTPSASTDSYPNDLDLAVFAQQLAAAGTTGTPTQTTQSETLGALQANFNALLGADSPVNSMAVAAANSAVPSLPVFVQAVAENLSSAVAAVGPISPFGNLIETTV